MRLHCFDDYVILLGAPPPLNLIPVLVSFHDVSELQDWSRALRLLMTSWSNYIMTKHDR